MVSGSTWRAFLAGGLGILVLALALGPRATHIGVIVVSILGAATIFVGIRSHRPKDPVVWLAILATCCSLAIASGLRWYENPDPDQYPVLADYADVVSYALGVFALYRLSRQRVRIDRTNLIDVLVPSLAVLLLTWLYVVVPDLHSDTPIAGKWLNGAFSVISVTAVMLVTRVVTGPGARNTSYYFLAAAAGAGLLSDIVTTATLGGSHAWLADVPTGAVSVFVGVAALHPGMARLSDPDGGAVPEMTWRRMLALGASCMAPAFALLAGGYDGSISERLAIFACWCLLLGLILTRMLSLIRVRERLGRLDRALAAANADMAVATDRTSMLDSTVRRTLDVFDRNVIRASAIVIDDEGWVVIASTDSVLVGGKATMNDAALTALGGLTPRCLPDQAAVDGAIEIHPWSVLAPLVSFGRLRGGLVVGLQTEPMAEELNTLRSMVSNVSLALESASLTEQMHRRRSERRFRSLIESSNDIVMVVGPLGTPTFVSPAGPRLLGLEEAAIMGMPIEDLLVPEDRARFARVLERVDADLEQLRLLDQDGQAVWFEFSVADLRADPEVGGRVVTAREITDRKEAEHRVAMSEARFRSLVQHSSDVVSIIDREGNLTWISPSIQRVAGFRPEELVGVSIASLLVDPAAIERAGSLLAATDGSTHAFEVEIRTRSGEHRTLDATITDLTDDPNVNGFVINAHDVTERKRLEESLRFQALHDDLTGIPNRALFWDRAEQALARRRANESAMLLVDLDDFKTVNDGLGHHAGDELLKVLSFRLRQFMRSSDTVARLGGDEFGVLIEDVEDRDDLLLMAERLGAAIAAPLELGARDLVVTSSIGVVFSGDVPDATPETLLQCADMAMYEAKGRGKNRIHVFEPAMHGWAIERLELRTELLSVLERDELEAWYQPIVDLQHGTVVGFEALLRWRHPERGLLSPAVFVGLAEETGMIVELGRWVVVTSIHQLAHWRNESGLDLSMEINVSPVQLSDSDFPNFLRNLLVETGVPPSSVILELTESVEMDLGPSATLLLERLRDLGVHLYADDFGSGYANYASLQRLPYTGVKLDMSLIEGMGDHGDRQANQVAAIIDMAKRAGLDVVAEGIESGHQLGVLIELGCQHGQGYFFGRPAPASDQDQLVAATRRHQRIAMGGR